MSWPRYQMTKESEKELAKFLEAVSKQKSLTLSNSAKSLLEQYIPANPEVKPHHTESSNKHKDQQTEIIVLDDDDSNDSEAKSPEIETKQFSVHIDDEELACDDLLETVKELLNSEDVQVLPSTIVAQLYHDSCAEKLEKTLVELNETESNLSFLKLWSSIFAAECLEKATICKTFIKTVILKRIYTDQSIDFKALLSKVVLNCPEESGMLLEKELIDCTGNVNVLRNNLRSLPKVQKDVILHAFVNSCKQLKTQHLDTALCLVSKTSSAKNLNVLVELLYPRAKDFQSEKSCGKLILEIVDALKVNVAQKESQLRYIITNHRSIFLSQILKSFDRYVQEMRSMSRSMFRVT